LNKAFHCVYGTYLYKERSVESRIGEAKRYKRLLISGEDDFKRFISELNEVISENTNNAGLRALLSQEGVDFEQGCKGNKLLELVYSNILHDSENLIAPFFYLYDLRLWADHSGLSYKLTGVAGKLQIDRDNYTGLFARVVSGIRDSATALQTKIST
jgi:hypothetical protein